MIGGAVYPQLVDTKLVSVNDKSVWIRFPPPVPSFTVELPAFPIQGIATAELTQKNIELQFFKCTKAVNYYFLPSRTNPKYSRLMIREIDVSSSNCSRKEVKLEDEILGLVLVDVGDNYSTLSDKKVELSGFRGREIVYKLGSEIYGRMLVLDAGKRIFVVTYDRKNGDLLEEERIFRTFKPKFIKRSSMKVQT